LSSTDKPEAATRYGGTPRQAEEPPFPTTRGREIKKKTLAAILRDLDLKEEEPLPDNVSKGTKSYRAFRKEEEVVVS